MQHEKVLPIEEWVRAARVYAADCVGWFAATLYAAPLHLSDALPAPAAIDRYGRVYFNPLWVARLYEACGHDRHQLVQQLAQVWYHEVAHWLRAHAERAEAIRADAQLWNLAADLEINDYLPDGMAYPSLGGEPIVVLPRRFNLPEGEIAEWYYQRLVERLREQVQAGGRQQQSQAPPHLTPDKGARVQHGIAETGAIFASAGVSGQTRVFALPSVSPSPASGRGGTAWHTAVPSSTPRPRGGGGAESEDKQARLFGTITVGTQRGAGDTHGLARRRD